MDPLVEALINFISIPATKLLTGDFLVGALGSVAYFTALYFRFIGGVDAHRSIILRPFLKKKTIHGKGIE